MVEGARFIEGEQIEPEQMPRQEEEEAKRLYDEGEPEEASAEGSIQAMPEQMMGLDEGEMEDPYGAEGDDSQAMAEEEEEEFDPI